MHSVTILDDGSGDLTMIRNSDYSGNVELVYSSHYGKESICWTLPGWVVQAIRTHALSEVVEWLRAFPAFDIEDIEYAKT